MDIVDKTEIPALASDVKPIILPSTSTNGVTNGKTVNHGKKSEAENRKQRIVDVRLSIFP